MRPRKRLPFNFNAMRNSGRSSAKLVIQIGIPPSIRSVVSLRAIIPIPVNPPVTSPIGSYALLIANAIIPVPAAISRYERIALFCLFISVLIMMYCVFKPSFMDKLLKPEDKRRLFLHISIFCRQGIPDSCTNLFFFL